MWSVVPVLLCFDYFIEESCPFLQKFFKHDSRKMVRWMYIVYIEVNGGQSVQG